jgi:GTP-binding protein
VTEENPSIVKSHDIPAGLRGLPIVAIVGRPNVGKSTLFNRLARQKAAIVHDEPGVTRDRHYADTLAYGHPYTLVDTGGFDPDSDDPMQAGIASHVRAAIKEADVVVFLSDGAGLNSLDRAAVTLLRESNKPVLYVANKADTAKLDADAFELYRLGIDNVLPISALHGRGIAQLENAIVAALPKRTEDPPPADESITRVAIVGRPNAGKSSLLNRILGEDRMLVDDRPGTTRDSIDTFVERGDKKYIFIDTAGIRKKGRVTKAEDAVESMSVLHAIRGMERAQVVVLMCDAKDGVAEQDAKILGLAQDRLRGMVIALNKSDLLSKDELKKAEESARDKISFAPYVPVVRMSAKTGRGVSDLFAAIDNVKRGFTQRVGTGELNRFFEEVLATRPPPTMGGKAPRLYYITQAEAGPPKFVVMASAAEAVHFSYRRFVMNQLRKKFGFEGVPLNVFYKGRKRSKDRQQQEGEQRKKRRDRASLTKREN